MNFMNCCKDCFPLFLDYGEKIAVIAGFVFAIQQWIGQKKQLQIKYTEKFSSSIMKDKDIADFIHMIEREGSVGFSVFCENGKRVGVFNNPENERKTDYALTTLSNFLLLKKKKIISEKNFQFYDYVLEHTLKNDEIQEYLKFLLDDVVKGNRDAHPYKLLLDASETK